MKTFKVYKYNAEMQKRIESAGFVIKTVIFKTNHVLILVK